jgi:hypothetical protein
LCVSPLRSDGANKLVNQFASNRFRPLNGSRSDFEILMRVRFPDLFRGDCWRSVRQLDSVIEEFSFEARPTN